jgi:uncharacterized protein YlxW (UPF0749 family)
MRLLNLGMRNPLKTSNDNWGELMKLNISKFNVLVLCMLLGILISLQFKSLKGEYQYVPLKTIYDYKLSIEREKKEIENLQQVLHNRTERVEEYEGVTKEGGIFKETMLEELKNYKLISGFMDVAGPGIVLIVDDGKRELEEGEHPNEILVHDIDILNLVNDLKNAGAEAISINGQRLLSNSEISCAGHTIRINDQVFAQPFIIKAIGEPKTLEASLIAPGTYGFFLKDIIGLYVEVNTGMNIDIPKYSEEINFRHLKLREEGE